MGGEKTAAIRAKTAAKGDAVVPVAATSIGLEALVRVLCETVRTPFQNARPFFSKPFLETRAGLFETRI